jgi:hypothetical protein
MNRKDFITTSAILSGACLLPSNNAFSQSLQQSGLDKLIDEIIDLVTLRDSHQIKLKVLLPYRM